MRLWTIHPKYLDQKGLVALWREGLLAQKVLEGATRGYRNHPQLIRFKTSSDPIAAIHRYLLEVYREAQARGYSFDKSKIGTDAADLEKKIAVTSGQVEYEYKLLQQKMMRRDEGRFLRLREEKAPCVNAIFTVVEGGVEAWEHVKEEIAAMGGVSFNASE